MPLGRLKPAVFALILFTAILFTQRLAAQGYVFNCAAFAAGNNPSAAVVADFNGDGFSDLAVANFNDNTVSILLGKADGTFSAQQTFAVGQSPVALVAADFNGDGIMDLAVLNANGQSISVLLGNGDGTFSTHMDYPVGNTQTGIAVGDFDGDNKIDIVVSDAGDNDVSIFFGNGDGSFQSRMTVPVGSYPLGVAVGDLNRDGLSDLATTNLGDATVSVVLGSKSRSYTASSYPSGITATRNNSSIVIADFDNDGLPDAVVLDGSHPIKETESLSRLMFLKGNGDGSLKAPKVAVSFVNTLQGAMVVADFNLDKNPDIAIASFVVLGNGDGTFKIPIPFANGTLVATIDANFDGIPDMVALDPNYNSVEVWLGNGDGTFASQSILSFGSTAYGPDASVAGDFNQDGKLDIAVAETNFPNGQLSVRLGNGDGTFQNVVTTQLKSNAINNGGILLAGVFSNGGKPDLLLADDYLKGFTTLLGNGDGTFVTSTDTPLSFQANVVAVGDLNGDGYTDFVTSYYTTATGQQMIAVYLSNGDGSFHFANTFATPYQGSLTIADLVKDGAADLIVSSPGGILVYLGNGDGTFKTPITAPSVSTPGRVTVDDFNGDGYPDMVIPTYGGIAFLAGNGDGTFNAPVYSNSSYAFTAPLITGDFNGDGKPDVVSTPPSNVVASGAIVMLGKGDGTFSVPMAFGAAGAQLNIVAGDFDGDGKTDLAMPNRSSQTGDSEAVLYLSKTSYVPKPNFVVGVASNGSLSANVSAGSSATYSLQISPVNGFSGSIDLACQGLPVGASCSPSQLTVSGSSATLLALNISTTSTSQAVLLNRPRRPYMSWTATAAVLFGLIFGGGLSTRRKIHSRLIIALIISMVLLTLVSCGSGGGSSSSGSSTTPTGTYKFVLTANSASLSHSVNLTLTVN